MAKNSEDIENRLKQIYDAYNGNGNKEIALFLTDKWTLHVGNPSIHVQLGEVKGEHCFEASSLQEVLSAAENELLHSLKPTKKKQNHEYTKYAQRVAPSPIV